MSEEKVTAFDIKSAIARKHTQDFFLTEVKNGSTYFPPVDGMKILDGLAIKKSYTKPCFTGYEVKVSRSDFLRDAKYHTYSTLVNQLYVVCPKGMIDKAELPEHIGLMYYHPDSGAISTRKKAIYRQVEYSADMLLYIIYSRLDSDRIPFFSDREEYIRAYLKDKQTGRSLSYAFKSKMLEEIKRLQDENDKLSQFKKMRERYLSVEKILLDHRLIPWGGGPEATAAALEKALERKVPAEVESVRKSLAICVETLKKLEETP